MTTRRTALITGANSGIGKTIATRLARAGYDVAINYKVDEAAAASQRTDDEVRDLLQRIEKVIFNNSQPIFQGKIHAIA